MVAIYARQSIEKKDSISIETQINMCKREVVPGDIIKLYQDKGFSGKNINRPGFQSLLNDIEEGTIKKLVVYRLDRISRSITDFANIIEILEKFKVSFVSTNEKFDTSTPVGRAMLFIIMIFAQLERETIAERIRDNYYARGQNGVWLGGPAPLGYSIIKKIHGGKRIAALEKNDQISLVKEIYDRYADSNVSLGSLARSMREKYGGMWNNIKLARILHNPAYVSADADIYRYFQHKKAIIINPIEEFSGKCGCSLYGKRDRGKNKYNSFRDQILAVALHDGIVDSDVWLRCQQKMADNKQIKNTGKGKYSWLTGIVKCGYCGYSMRVTSYDSPHGKYRYLNCSGRGISNECVEEIDTHRLEDIEGYVSSEIEKILVQFADQPYIMPRSDNAQDINTLKIELHRVEMEIENLISSIASANKVLIGYVNNRINELDEEKNNLLDKINNASITRKRPIHIPDVAVWINADLETRRDIAHTLIEKVIVKNKGIDIAWNL